MIIDFHTHTFPDKSSEKIVNHLAHTGCIPPHTDGSVIGLFSSMKEADIDYSVNLPVMTKPGQVEKVNSSLIMQKEYLLDMKIITFGGMHPDYVNYKEELLRLKQAGIPGIKLHPAYQNVDLDDIRMMRIIDEASSQGLITLVHAGIDIGIYDHNYSSVAHILKLLKDMCDKYQKTIIVVTHNQNIAKIADVIVRVKNGKIKSYEEQEKIYQETEQKYGGAYAAEYVATPGASEHQTGLGIDMTSQSVVDKQRLVFGDTTEYKWVVENCAKYGFIVRFTEGTDGITGISHEPWHLRYVGKKVAKEIKDQNWTLEEYCLYKNVIPKFKKD